MQGLGFPTTQQKAPVAHAAVESEFRDTEARQIWREAGHRDGDEIFVTHGHDGQFDTGESGDVISVCAGGVDHVTTPGGSLVGLHASHPAIFEQDFLNSSGRGNTHAHFAAGVLVRVGNGARRHPAVARTPKHGMGAGEVHQRPTAGSFLVIDERSLQTGGISGLFELLKLCCSPLAQGDT